MISMVDRINRYLSTELKKYLIPRKKLKKYCAEHITEYFENSNNGETFIKDTNIKPETIYSEFLSLKKENIPTLMMLKRIKEKYTDLEEAQICYSIIYGFSRDNI